MQRMANNINMLKSQCYVTSNLQFVTQKYSKYPIFLYPIFCIIQYPMLIVPMASSPLTGTSMPYECPNLSSSRIRSIF